MAGTQVEDSAVLSSPLSFGASININTISYHQFYDINSSKMIEQTLAKWS
jgi:hypothetical protein